MEYENTAGSLRISSEVVASIAEYAVKDAVQSMTGIEVATVNLYIAGVSAARPEAKAE